MPIKTTRGLKAEEKRLRDRVIIITIVILALIVCMAVFGLPIFVRYTLLLSGGSEGGPSDSMQTTIHVPPQLDPLPQATNSGRLVIRGRSTANGLIKIYVDAMENTSTRVKDDGTFESSPITLSEGDHTVWATVQYTDGTVSTTSNKMNIAIRRKAPKLDLTKPNNDETIRGENNLIVFEGKTEPGVDVRINGRFVIVQTDGTFSYEYPLQDGKQDIAVVATDVVGNSTTINRTITYEK